MLVEMGVGITVTQKCPQGESDTRLLRSRMLTAYAVSGSASCGGRSSQKASTEQG